MSEYYPPPRRALGQNFLTDGNIIAKILRSAAIEAEDFVLEVGPGRGALTDLLVQRAAQVVAVEFDRELARILRLRFSENPQVVIHEQDILKVDFAQLLGDRRYKVVANLPYNISTPVLFRFLKERRRFSRLVLMLQKEVGERLAAKADCADYGIVTVLLGMWFDIRREFPVAPGSFYPIPKVDSVVISLTPRPEPLAAVTDHHLFERVVRAAFGQRRKTLSNCLKGAELADYDRLAQALADSGIDGKRRGETLTIQEFAGLANSLASLLKH